MTITVGDRIPDVTVHRMTEGGGPQPVSTQELFADKTAVVFAVPGAFTPTCSAKHLPGFIEQAEKLKGKGIDMIACISVNDPFVMEAWAKSSGTDRKVEMLADGNGEFAKAVGQELDASRFGMGTRSQRYAMVVDHGEVKALYVDQPGAFEVSSAENVLKNL